MITNTESSSNPTNTTTSSRLEACCLMESEKLVCVYRTPTVIKWKSFGYFSSSYPRQTNFCSWNLCFLYFSHLSHSSSPEHVSWHHFEPSYTDRHIWRFLLLFVNLLFLSWNNKLFIRYWKRWPLVTLLFSPPPPSALSRWYPEWTQCTDLVWCDRSRRLANRQDFIVADHVSSVSNFLSFINNSIACLIHSNNSLQTPTHWICLADIETFYRGLFSF